MRWLGMYGDDQSCLGTGIFCYYDLLCKHNLVSHIFTVHWVLGILGPRCYMLYVWELAILSNTCFTEATL